jgi:MYXO-CTERM domain-containing protein
MAGGSARVSYCPLRRAHGLIATMRLVEASLGVRHGLLSCLVLAACASEAGDGGATRGAPEALPEPAAHATGARIAPELTDALGASPAAQVVVELEEPGGATVEARRAAIRERGERVLAGAPRGVVVHHRFLDSPVFSATITLEGLRALRASPGVRSVGIDHRSHGTLAFSTRALHAVEVHQTYGFAGKGVTVAVLDSGVDATHPDLAGQVVAQQCFTHSACPPGDTDQGTEAPDVAGHGTSVASIVASRGMLGPAGFAPEAKLVAVRVLDDNAEGYVSDWAAGLEWIYTNLSTTAVQVVNMSLGSSTLYGGPCDSDTNDASIAVTAGIAAQLGTSGVTMFASTGNDGSATETTAPACVTGVIGVGATYSRDFGRQPWIDDWATFAGSEFPTCSDATTGLDTITCFTNSGPQLALLAPGALILTAAPGDQLEFWFGTSMASPTAAGTAALMLQANAALSPARIAALLAQTGKPLTDPKSGVAVPLIDALAAVQAAVCDGKADGTACDDGNACTQGDTCAAGVCHGKALADGTACDDGDACTSDDTCTAGACAGKTSVTCVTAPCSFTSECKPETATCTSYTPPHWYDAQACMSGTCSTSGSCNGGVCDGAQAIACPTLDACQTASCDPAKLTCDAADAPDGTACPGGACKAGACVPSAGTSTGTGAGTGTGGGSPGSSGPASSGCGCAVPGHAPGSYAVAVALAALGLARRRRRAPAGYSRNRTA